MIKDGEVIKIMKIAGEGKIPVGYEAGGVFYEDSPPTVGKKYRCGGFVTAEVIEVVDKLTFKTATTTYQLVECTADTFLCPSFGKCNDIFDNLVIDEDKPGFGIYDDHSQSRALTEKMTSAVNFAKRDKTKALKLILPTLTTEEIAFLIGVSISEGISQKSEAEKSIPKPKSLSDLLGFIKRMKDKNED